MKSDIEIARETDLRKIKEVATTLGIPREEVQNYGRYIAKVPIHLIDKKQMDQHNLILVTAITPTKAGIGKTTVSIGLALGLNKIGKKAVVALREPSLGPCFGMKGGAAGGGYAQVLPMENINLQLLRKINCLLTGLLAIIGFSCGENGEIPCEYGSPHANFQIKGKVTDMKGEPIPDLQVRINPSGESHPQGWLHTDTLQTDTNGDFIFSKTDFPFMEYRLIIEDIDWDKNKAIYASDTITVTFDSNDFSGGEGWSLGSASKEIQIQLKEYIDTHTEPYTLYTFYGRVTDQDGWPVPGVTIYTSPAYTPNIDEDITSFPAVTDETGRYQFTYDQAPATEHTLYARLSPSFSDPQYPWKTDSIVVNFGEIELIDGEGMLIGRGSKEVNFQLVHSSPQK